VGSFEMTGRPQELVSGPGAATVAGVVVVVEVAVAAVVLAVVAVVLAVVVPLLHSIWG